MKKVPISSLCGFGAMLITTILYFLILGNIFAEIICFITLLGVLLAEGVTTLLAFLSKGNPRKVAAAGVSALMVPISILLSAIYIVNFPNGYGKYIGWYFTFFIAVVILAAVLFAFDGKKQAENAEFQNAKSNMLALRKLVKCILLEEAAKEYAKPLGAIEEKLHFSSDNVITEDDANIRTMLLELKDNIANPEFDTTAALEKIAKAIDTRNILSGRNV